MLFYGGCLLWNHIDLFDTLYNKYRFLLIPFFSLLTCTVFFFHHHYSENLYISINYIGISLSATFWVYFFLKNRFSPFHIILTNPLMVTIGIISYELYLIHQIINGFASRTILKNTPVGYTLFVVIGSIFGGYLFNRFYNRPIQLYLRKKFDN